MATVRIPELKVILCGEYGVGKTSLFRRFSSDTFVRATDRASTLGLDNYGKVYALSTDNNGVDKAEEATMRGLHGNGGVANNESVRIPPFYRRDIKLQLWDTGGMERVASITSSYYKYSEAAILVFALDNPDSFHILSQHILDIVTYAENAKIFLCGNKFDLKSRIAVTDSDIEALCEQCNNLVSGVYKTSCKTNQGVQEMFLDIARQLGGTNRSRIELQNMDANSFRVERGIEAQESTAAGGQANPGCNC